MLIFRLGWMVLGAKRWLVVSDPEPGRRLRGGHHSESVQRKERYGARNCSVNAAESSIVGCALLRLLVVIVVVWLKDSEWINGVVETSCVSTSSASIPSQKPGLCNFDPRNKHKVMKEDVLVLA
mmetsp:Transcript_36223/g.66868  ORF Transcript_36223/g.66868 Transcript_36223/m.66868 type:complete len:124 (-) Transcript_36223:173-544(-)